MLKRIFAIIKIKDVGKVPTKQADYWKRKVDARSGSLPKGSTLVSVE